MICPKFSSAVAILKDSIDMQFILKLSNQIPLNGISVICSPVSLSSAQ